MADKFTCNVFQFGDKTAQRIRLLGDKEVKIEAAQHVIEFPGGAVEISRTTDGNYWAHLIVNRGDVLDDVSGFRSCQGQIVGSRIDYEHPVNPCVIEVPNGTQVSQIALFIRPIRG